MGAAMLVHIQHGHCPQYLISSLLHYLHFISSSGQSHRHRKVKKQLNIMKYHRN